MLSVINGNVVLVLHLLRSSIVDSRGGCDVDSQTFDGPRSFTGDAGRKVDLILVACR
jgi:hypothetical protein